MKFDLKVNYKDLERNLMDVINKCFSKEDALAIAEQARTLIYGRTKQGKDYRGEKLKGLSQAYIYYRGQNVLGPFGSPRKSNLTFSGELLESMIARAIGKTGEVRIPSTPHSGSGTPLSYIVKYQEEQGRKFFELSEKEKAIIFNSMARLIRQNIRKLRSGK